MTTLTLGLDFVLIWTVILAVGVFFYVLLDGFDLGVGMLYGLTRNSAHRAIIMNSIAPVWDGNETWLILGGLALLAAFPLAFAISARPPRINQVWRCSRPFRWPLRSSFPPFISRSW